MEKKLLRKMFQTSFLILIFTTCSIEQICAQNFNQGVYLSWDKQFGCQVWETEINEDLHIPIENIEESECLKVCENSEVVFELHNLPETVTDLIWIVNGGGV